MTAGTVWGRARPPPPDPRRHQETGYPMGMSPLVRQLAEKLDQWEPEVSRKVESLVAEIMDLADTGALELLRSREVEQEVLDLLELP